MVDPSPTNKWVSQYGAGLETSDKSGPLSAEGAIFKTFRSQRK